MASFRYILTVFFVIFLLVSPIECGSKSDFIKSIFPFGKKKPTTTMSPYAKGSSSRCNTQTSQCSAYECCNSNQSCIRNRCFPRLSNCPVTRDQCGQSCCRTSEICRNGQCVQ